MAKSCYQIFRKLIEQWTGNDANNLPGFSTFIMSDIIPMLMKHPFKPELDIQDATSHMVVYHTDLIDTFKVLKELAQIQIDLFGKSVKDFSTYMRGVILPSLQCPQNVTEQYIQVLEANNPNQFKSFFIV